MCGIGGILRVWPASERDLALRTPHAQSIPEPWLDILDDSIKHRGPDGQGRFRDRALRADGCIVDVAFVHRRLSIIDHAGGHQPMVHVGTPALRAGRLLSPSEVERWNAGVGQSITPGSESRATRNVAVVFNGCIYNHRELRAELQRAGHVFSTDHSDTEVLVHGWREWGRGLFARLDGMYALGVWDSAQGTLTIARDIFGEKPLYHGDGVLAGARCAVFGSSVPALEIILRSVDRSPLPDGFDWVRPWIKFGWNQGIMPLSSIREELAGFDHQMLAEQPDDGVLPAGFARLGNMLNPTKDELSMGKAETLLVRAVESRLEADVSLGSFLSGGLDSAIVTLLAARRRPDIESFTVRMPESGFDESAQAAETARAIGVRHSILDCHADPAADLERAIHQLGLPFGDSSLLPSLWVSRAAKQHVSVVLSGDGGDEMFLGYERHRAIPWLQRLAFLPRTARAALAESVQEGAMPRSRRTRMARLLNAAAGDGYKELVAIFSSPLDAELGLREAHQHGFGVITHFGLTLMTHDELAVAGALRFDRWFYLPCDLMRKSDTASMSVALEVRSPFLQTDLAAACVNAPMSSLMPRGERKGLLKQVARKYFPAEIVDRPKMGFAIPIGEWFRSDYGGLRTMLLDHLNSVEPFGPPSLGIDLNMKFIRRMLDEHIGSGPSGIVRRDHSQRLYMLLVLSIWAKWVGGLRVHEPRP